jgi:hypothetical protein
MTEHDEIRTEPDEPHGELVAIGLIVTAVAIAASIAVVRLLGQGALGGAHEAGGGRTGPIPVAPTRVDQLPTTPFEAGLAAERARLAKTRELDGWSWDDRAARRVRVPLDVAARRYLDAHGGTHGDAHGGAP